jgi:hypothetical protein
LSPHRQNVDGFTIEAIASRIPVVAKGNRPLPVLL